ncbi:tail fiber domain-containing protein, partial [Peptostreptococcus sp.]
AMWWNKDGELTLPKVKAREIEAGAITTDILYPGTNERIILEEGYSPGANDCKSIDANGDAIRLKVNAGTYIAMKDTGSIGMYSRGSQFFSFNPNVGWDWGSASGDGELNLYDAHVIMGWLGYYVYSVRSDRRVKDNIKYIKNNDSTINRNNIFDFVKSVDLATYQYKKIGGNNISMIAQDVQKFRFIQDYLVVKDTEGLLSINMGNYHSMVHITLQEEIKKREELESKVNKLENELEEIKKLLKKEGE